LDFKVAKWINWSLLYDKGQYFKLPAPLSKNQQTASQGVMILILKIICVPIYMDTSCLRVCFFSTRLNQVVTGELSDASRAFMCSFGELSYSQSQERNYMLRYVILSYAHRMGLMEIQATTGNTNTPLAPDESMGGG
jgi:hypothetical protein